MNRLASFLLAFAVVAIAGCSEDLGQEPIDTSCPELPTADLVFIESGAGTYQIGEASVSLRGTAEHTLGLAIRRITVAGIDATSESFNFAAWAADVPGEVIDGLLDDDAALPTNVDLTVIAYEPCMGTAPGTITTATVRVEDAPVDAGVAD